MSYMNRQLYDKMKQRAKEKVKQVGNFYYTVKNGVVSDEEYRRRLEICKPCPEMKKEGDKLYCDACGCPKWKLSSLNDPIAPKLKWANLVCPKGRFGSMAGAIQVLTKDEIKNLVTTAKKLINANLVPTKERPAPSTGATPIDWNKETVTYPTDGFLTPADLQSVNQKMTEAIVKEQFDEGLKFAFLVFALLRP